MVMGLGSGSSTKSARLAKIPWPVAYFSKHLDVVTSMDMLLGFIFQE
jgi:hypothetical protein